MSHTNSKESYYLEFNKHYFLQKKRSFCLFGFLIWWPLYRYSNFISYLHISFCLLIVFLLYRLLVALLSYCLPLQKGIFLFNNLHFLLPCVRDIYPAYTMHLLIWNFICLEDTFVISPFPYLKLLVLDFSNEHTP